MRFVWSSFVSSFTLAALLIAGATATADAAPGWDGDALRSVARAPGVRVVASSRAGSAVETVDALERAGYHVGVASTSTWRSSRRSSSFARARTRRRFPRDS